MIILYEHTVHDLGKCKNQLVVIAMKHMADKSKFSDRLSVISDLSAHYTANRSTRADRHLWIKIESERWWVIILIVLLAGF